VVAAEAAAVAATDVADTRHLYLLNY